MSCVRVWEKERGNEVKQNEVGKRKGWGKGDRERCRVAVAANANFVFF